MWLCIELGFVAFHITESSQESTGDWEAKESIWSAHYMSTWSSYIRTLHGLTLMQLCRHTSNTICLLSLVVLVASNTYIAGGQGGREGGWKVKHCLGEC